MTQGKFPIEAFKQLRTPFYFYDTQLLRNTVQTAVAEATRYGYHLHYAVKANANPRILSIINEYGIGADCVSGGEIQAALNAGFPADKIVFAGVGKADWEINLGLENEISCFNVESLPELEVINEWAAEKGKTARIALRINPEVDAHTHHHITTGKKENKFGISLEQLDAVLDRLPALSQLKVVGIHFHIGSQLQK
jgi:diaminopimelate decarboxylase